MTSWFVRNQVLSDREKRRFRRRRRTATVAYLKDIRADFSRIWTVCRLLTPLNPDPNFSIVLLRQWVVFHGYYAVAQRLLPNRLPLLDAVGFQRVDAEPEAVGDDGVGYVAVD